MVNVHKSQINMQRFSNINISQGNNEAAPNKSQNPSEKQYREFNIKIKPSNQALNSIGGSSF